jgi:hypothetical protein
MTEEINLDGMKPWDLVDVTKLTRDELRYLRGVLKPWRRAQGIVRAVDLAMARINVTKNAVAAKEMWDKSHELHKAMRAELAKDRRNVDKLIFSLRLLHMVGAADELSSEAGRRLELAEAGCGALMVTLNKSAGVMLAGRLRPGKRWTTAAMASLICESGAFLKMKNLARDGKVFKVKRPVRSANCLAALDEVIGSGRTIEEAYEEVIRRAGEEAEQ